VNKIKQLANMAESKKEGGSVEMAQNLLDTLSAANVLLKPIDKATFVKVMQQVSGGKTEEGTLKRLFECLDTNHNGTVDMQEFLTGYTVVAQGSVEQKSTLIFHALDSNGDGYLSKEELKKGLQRCYKGSLKMSSNPELRSSLKGSGLWSGEGGGDRKFLTSSVPDTEKIDSDVNVALEEVFKMDDNQDGKISLAEWTKHSKTNSALKQLLTFYGLY
jgi:Ca2+-binding EF-hand superfamily protein